MGLKPSFAFTPNLFKLSVPVPAMDVAIFTVKGGELFVALVTRDVEPQKGKLALPGGIIARGYSLEENFDDVLERKAGLRGVYKEQLAAFGDPGRDSRGHVLTVAFWALVAQEAVAPAAADGRVVLVPFAKLAKAPVAFDHADIIRAAKRRLDARLATTGIAAEILPERFTLTRMQAAYEAILGKPLDKRNFRKRVEALGLLKDTLSTDTSGSRRPAKLYSMRKDLQEATPF